MFDPALPGRKLRGERFAGRVEIRQQRMEPEPALVGRGRSLLLGVRGDERAVEIDHIEPRIRARRPRRRRAAARAAAIRASSVSSTASRARHAVGDRRHLTEQVRLIAQHRQIGDRFAAIGEHHRQIDQHPAAVMAPTTLLRRRHRRRQPLGQPELIGQIAQQARTRMATTCLPSPVTHSRGRVELRCISEVPSWARDLLASTTAVSLTRRAFSRTRPTISGITTERSGLVGVGRWSRGFPAAVSVPS